MDDLILTLLTNVLLLLGIASIFSILLKRVKDFSLFENIITGLFVGAVMVAIMSNSFVISGDIFIDARTIAIASSGIFLGPIPTLIGGIIGIVFRILEGGDYILAGSLWILIAGILGLVFNYYYITKKSKTGRTWYEYLVFATLLQFIMLMILYIFIPVSRLEGFQAYLIFSLLVLFPLSHTLLALFMEFNMQRVKHYYQMLSHERQYRSLFEQGKTIHFLLNPKNGAIIDVNVAAIEKYGYTYNEFTSMNISEINNLTSDEILYDMERARKNEKNFFEFKHLVKDGRLINVEVYAGPVIIEDIEYIYSTVIDVTEKEFQRKMFLDRNQQLITTLKLINEAIIVTDEYHNMIIANDKAKEFLDVEILPENKKIYHALKIESKNNSKSFKELLNEIITSNDAYSSENRWTLKSDFKTIDIAFSISPILQKGVFNGSVLMIRDISKELSHKEQIEYVSYHDYLTGLFNRHFFETELKRLDTKRQLPLTLFIADVNELKLINDAFGHLEGDELIKEVANIFKKSVRTEDIVARWGGDEFAILLPQTSEADAGIVYQRIQKLLQRTGYDKFKPSVSIGYATKNSESVEMTTLLKIAEERMYEQKLKTGKSVKKEIINQIFKTLVNDGIEPDNHISNLQEHLSVFGEYLELNKEENEKLQLLAKFHDIGKIGIVKDTLLKSSPLTKSELEQIKIHPTLGSKLINVVDDYKIISKEISMSHEHFNGHGYPYGLEGTEIPKLVRIFAIVEAYSIMTMGTNYKGKISKDNALEELKNEAGQQFDPYYVEEFLKAIK